MKYDIYFLLSHHHLNIRFGNCNLPFISTLNQQTYTMHATLAIQGIKLPHSSFIQSFQSLAQLARFQLQPFDILLSKNTVQIFGNVNFFKNKFNLSLLQIHF